MHPSTEHKIQTVSTHTSTLNLTNDQYLSNQAHQCTTPTTLRGFETRTHQQFFFPFAFLKQVPSSLEGEGRRQKKKWGKKCEARTRTHTHGMCKKSAQCRLVYTHIHTGVLSHPLRMKGDQRVKLAPLSQVRPLEAASAEGSLASSPGSSKMSPLHWGSSDKRKVLMAIAKLLHVLRGFPRASQSSSHQRNTEVITSKTSTTMVSLYENLKGKKNSKFGHKLSVLEGCMTKKVLFFLQIHDQKKKKKK